MGMFLFSLSESKKNQCRGMIMKYKYKSMFPQQNPECNGYVEVNIG